MRFSNIRGVNLVNNLDVIERVRDGNLRTLATTSLTRIAGLPGGSTVAELGLPSHKADVWIGLLAFATAAAKPIPNASAPQAKQKGYANLGNPVASGVRRLPSIIGSFGVEDSSANSPRRLLDLGRSPPQ